MHLTRRGFTLIELIVALTLFGIVGALIYQTLTSTQRSAQAIAQRIDVQQNVRDAVHYLSSIMRELDASDGDIVTADSSEIEFRAMRWTGILCDEPDAEGSTVELAIRANAIYGARVPDQALDSLLIYRDGNTNTQNDDRWAVGALTDAEDGACADGTAARILTASITAASGGVDSVEVGVFTGAPIRGFQVEEITVFEDYTGRSWLGQRTASRTATWTSRQAMLGPLASNGLTFTYLDASGAATGAVKGIRSVRFVVRGESLEMARGTSGDIGYARDSLMTVVALRNNRRF